MWWRTGRMSDAIRNLPSSELIRISEQTVSIRQLFPRRCRVLFQCGFISGQVNGAPLPFLSQYLRSLPPFSAVYFAKELSSSNFLL